MTWEFSSSTGSIAQLGSTASLSSTNSNTTPHMTSSGPSSNSSTDAPTTPKPRNYMNKFNSHWKKFDCKIHLITIYILSVFALAFLLDSLYYGKATFSLWNFFKFNVPDGGSAHFGTHPWHWYFTQGLPPILGLSMYPALITALNLRKNLVKCITRKISNRFAFCFHI